MKKRPERLYMQECLEHNIKHIFMLVASQVVKITVSFERTQV